MGYSPRMTVTEKIQIIFIDKLIINPQFIDLDKHTAKGDYIG